MISTFPLRNDNLIGFTIDGTVDQAGLDKLIDLIEDRARAHDKIRLLANIRSVSGWDSLTTFWKNLRAKKELVGKIEKYALLSDSGWVKWMTGPVDWLFPGIEYRHFQLSEGEAAHTWLAALLSPEPPAALRRLDMAEDGVLGLAISGTMQPKDYETLNILLDTQVEAHGKAKLYLEIIDWEGINFRSLFEDFKTSLRYYAKIERMAVIGDQSWLKAATKISDLLTPGLEMQAFPTTDRKRAIGWLG